MGAAETTREVPCFGVTPWSSSRSPTWSAPSIGSRARSGIVRAFPKPLRSPRYNVGENVLHLPVAMCLHPDTEILLADDSRVRAGALEGRRESGAVYGVAARRLGERKQDPGRLTHP